eukprot:COSAG01_NODE_24780_length_766_cov_7.655172_2_plen_35_part_01
MRARERRRLGARGHHVGTAARQWCCDGTGGIRTLD